MLKNITRCSNLLAFRRSYLIMLCGSILVSCLTASIKSNGQPMDTSAMTAGLAGASVALPKYTGDFNNPAALATTDLWHVSFFASQGFGLPALRFVATQIKIPFAGHAIGFRIQGFGLDVYNESLWQVSVGRRHFPNASRSVYSGITFSYKHLAIENYGHGGVFALQLGSLFTIRPNVYWGFTYQQALTSEDDIPFPIAGKVGFAFQPEEGLWLLTSIRKEALFPFSLAMGIEAPVGKVLQLRCGFATQPSTLSLGSAIQIGTLSIGLAAERHTLLGWTPGISIDL